MPSLLLNAAADGYTGWGWNFANLARHASKAGWDVYGQLDWSGLPPEWQLEGWCVHYAKPRQTYDAAIYPAGNLHKDPTPRISKVAIVETFFEDTTLEAEHVNAYNSADYVIAGSTWNAGLLEAAGVKNVRLIHQGADQYATHAPMNDGRRRIFSGGKWEHRKGQDIVLKAFELYLERDPHAVLVAAWHNASLPLPPHDVIYHIPSANLVQYGQLPSYALQRVMAGCDVSVWPSRVEGGTNLPAMECLAAGVPTIFRNTTGQQDLIAWGGVPHDSWDFKDTDAERWAYLMDWTIPPPGVPKPPSWADHAAKVLQLCV